MFLFSGSIQAQNVLILFLFINICIASVNIFNCVKFLPSKRLIYFSSIILKYTIYQIVHFNTENWQNFKGKHLEITLFSDKTFYLNGINFRGHKFSRNVSRVYLSPAKISSREILKTLTKRPNRHKNKEN